MNVMKRLVVILGMVVALVAFMTPGRARASAVLDFGTGLAGVGGNVTLLAGGNMSGTDIPIDVFIRIGLISVQNIDMTGGFLRIKVRGINCSYQFKII